MAYFLNPFLLWTDLALQTAGLMQASAEVIGHRTQRMAKATLPPNARDAAEFTLMGQEKVEAAAESLQAGVRAMMAFNPLSTLSFYTDIATMQADALRLVTSTTLPAALAGQAKLNRSMRKAADSAAILSDQSAKNALAVLKPVHSRATANARRLRKR